MNVKGTAASVALIVGLVAVPWRAPIRAEVERHVYRAKGVFTGRGTTMDAHWFAVEGGAITAVGQGELPPALRDAPFTDFGERVVVPGFVDAHVHFIDGGLALVQTDASGARDAAALKAVVERAERESTGRLVVLRNVGLEPFGGVLPDHARVVQAVGPQSAPLVLVLAGGHHVYANTIAIDRMGFATDAYPSGLFAEQAAFEAQRALLSMIDARTIAAAALTAQEFALRYGITAIGDNTFFPMSGAQYARMADEGTFVLHVALRSFGPMPVTRLAMLPLGAGRFGHPGPQVRYFGDKFFLDGALSHGAAQSHDVAACGAPALRDRLLRAGDYGTAFHVQSRACAEALVEARTEVKNRRGAATDVLDHCGRCGGSGLPARIRASGLRVTLLPGLLHALPELLAAEPEADRAALLPVRELFDAGLEPALTSDWPYGAEVSDAELPDGFQRTGLAPLAQLAVAVHGVDTRGRAIPGAESRVVDAGSALLGLTRYGARAIGREDLGRIDVGARADFVVLPRSPFEASASELYRMDAEATYIDGRLVYARAAQPDAQKNEARTSRAAGFANEPHANAFAPALGYSPTTGALLGGAWFFYPYRQSQPLGSVSAYGSPSQRQGHFDADVSFEGALGRVSPRVALSVDNLDGRYYGTGMGTHAADSVALAPFRVDVSAGARLRLAPTLALGIDAKAGTVHVANATGIAGFGQGSEGPIDGAFAGGRVELVSDDRDNTFATRSGGRAVFWSETFGLVGGRAALAEHFGLSTSRFVTLLAPDLVLALRGEGAASFGQRSFATDYSLGGSDLLRGYYQNRFRGQQYAAGTGELRFPLIGPFSGAAFTDVGRVWVTNGRNQGRVAVSYGAGVRYALPPSRLARLRLDFACAPDQRGVFFSFGEAF